MPEPIDQPDTEREKRDEADHDLLTFGEVGERLRLEIAAAARDVRSAAESGTPEELDRAESRLRDLRAAAKRNTVSPINDANFEKFFGYPGTPRRNLSGPTPDDVV